MVLSEASQRVLLKCVTMLWSSGCRNSVGLAGDVARIIGTAPVVVGAAAAAEEEVASVADWVVSYEATVVTISRSQGWRLGGAGGRAGGRAACSSPHLRLCSCVENA